MFAFLGPRLRSTLRGLPLAAAIVRPVLRARFRSRSLRVFEAFLAGPRPHGLTIGAGQAPIAGWLNTDTVPFTNVWYLDASRRFPFDDGSLDYVYAEHVVEHIPIEDGLRTAGEFFRVLRSGGRLRLATPGLESLASLYEAPSTQKKRNFVEKYAQTFAPRRLGDDRAMVVNLSFRAHGHCFIYDKSSLGALLESAGFADVSFHEVSESNDPLLRGLETRAHGEFADLNAFETLVVEAVRP